MGRCPPLCATGCRPARQFEGKGADSRTLLHLGRECTSHFGALSADTHFHVFLSLANRNQMPSATNPPLSAFRSLMPMRQKECGPGKFCKIGMQLPIIPL